jgi:predicted hydrocarbon binding protein
MTKKEKELQATHCQNCKKITKNIKFNFKGVDNINKNKKVVVYDCAVCHSIKFMLYYAFNNLKDFYKFNIE